MLARRALPPEYAKWNRRWGAPFGRQVPMRKLVKRVLPWRLWKRLVGPFTFQDNSQTRRFEYPWAFHATPLTPGMRVVDVGGGMSGFQVVLAKKGLRVVNVDPGERGPRNGWRCSAESIALLNRLFGTSVELRNCTLAEAALPRAAYDRIFCISVLEHLPEDEVARTVRQVSEILKPGGFFVLTVDLFLDLKPFTDKTRNDYGENVPVASLLAHGPLELVQGERAELLGFPEFDPHRVLARREEWAFNFDPPLHAQCVVFQKPLSA